MILKFSKTSSSISLSEKSPAFIKLFFLAVFSSVALACSGGIPSSPDDLGLGRLEFQPLEPQSWNDSNGLRVLLESSDEIPLVSGKIYFPFGSLKLDASEQAVYAALGSQLREGGTISFRPEELDERLDFLGASIEVGGGGEYFTVGFSCLKEDLDEVFGIFSEVISQPSFNAKRLALWKDLVASGIQRRKDSPRKIASMIFSKGVYGWDSAYSRSLTGAEVRSVSRNGLKKMHQAYFGLSGSTLSVSGDIKRAELSELVKRYLVERVPLVAKKNPRNIVAEAEGLASAKIYLHSRKQDQAIVMLGHQGPKRHQSDWFPTKVFNAVFGGSSFQSELFNRVRSKKGLAYSVWGAISPGKEVGVFQVFAATKNEQALEATSEIIRIVKEMQTEPISEERLREAISSEESSFVFNFASPGAIVGRQATLELYGYPRGYNSNYVENMSSVSSEEVLQVANKRLKPENLVITIVGDIRKEDINTEFLSEITGLLGKQPEVVEVGFDTEPRLL